MTSKEYSWLTDLAALSQDELAKHRRPQLTLVSTEKVTAKRKPAMKKTIDASAKKEELAGVLNEAFESTQRKNGGYIRHLSDEARMVHNALEAVRSLAIPSSGTGEGEDMGNIGRNQFVDLLEIINSRLGEALRLDESRC